MSEPKDPGIKLFGKTIPLPEISGKLTATTTASNSTCGGGGGLDGDSQDQGCPSCADSSSPDESSTKGDVVERESDEKDAIGEKTTECKQEHGAPPENLKESPNPDGASGINVNPRTPTVERESSTSKASNTEEEQSDTSNSQEKTPKKPDKILPCPRCNSMDTKFCYYNNYNVNQPRHFCKNCQRYWTAGGTMRNVPVGAGRRKNKNSASNYRHITVTDAIQNMQTDVPNGVPRPILKTNGAVLTFGSDTPLHESMASVLNLADKTIQNCTRNGFHKPATLRVPGFCEGRENGDDHSNRTSVTTLNSCDPGKSGSQESVNGSSQGFPPQVPGYPGASWPYPWSTAQWSCPVVPPTVCPAAPAGFPMPFYPAATYWGCVVPGAWSIPWLPHPSSPKQTGLSSAPNSPTLGKHSRDENMPKSNNSAEYEPARGNNGERCLWIPKTLRIDDPSEAAKSSIWTTLGIKNERANSIGGKGVFNAFQSKGDEENDTSESLPVLKANPAALSRSLQFHETS
ncbi:hypothetical protein K2173_020091 [Erythroxylum novogranatense]|uniref:Dof-type domain-containing protein n=1 Tax=Erythroxylum novogranatense TaxID=1862640 RepID=A0AAV8U6Z2_9ROSI|nr:hypothetical protein K2173_020091 [Erythroxylum novogranatense]